MIRISENTYLNENKITTIRIIDGLDKSLYCIDLDDGRTYEIESDSDFKAGIDILLNRSSYEEKYYDLLSDLNDLKGYIRNRNNPIYKPAQTLFEIKKRLGIK